MPFTRDVVHGTRLSMPNGRSLVGEAPATLIKLRRIASVEKWEVIRMVEVRSASLILCRGDPIGLAGDFMIRSCRSEWRPVTGRGSRRSRERF